MKRMLRLFVLFPLTFSVLLNTSYAQTLDEDSLNSHIVTPDSLAKLLKTPPCLEGFWPNQSGPLSRLDQPEGVPGDSTFTVEHIIVPSDGLKINGFLYLPLGKGISPLVILTNGGGDDSRPIRNMSDWLAPILAHCGYAAFVHDKRGTGESEGEYVETTYEDYVTDAGNCAIYLSSHPRIDPARIGVIGGSEGGRIAVMTAAKYSEVSFVVSFAGTFVSAADDRIYAQKGWLKSLNLPDTTFAEVFDLHCKSIWAWESADPKEHRLVDSLIIEMRKKYERNDLPFTKTEMDSIPFFGMILPTWNTLKIDCMKGMEDFKKPWLAIYGAEDPIVPTHASVANIEKYMKTSGNENYQVVVIPRCGHAPIDLDTHRMIRIDNIMLNWLDNNILQSPSNSN